MGLLTVLGLKRQGYFIPYRYADDGSATFGRAGYPAIAAALNEARPAFEQALQAIEAVADDLQRIGPDVPPEPRWNQDWFPRLDAAVAYAIVRQYRPRQILEVGSGHSTRFLARAVRDGALTTEITSIDPAPRAVIAGLPLRQIKSTLAKAGRELFASLRAGDVLFVDSSHILMPGSDVDIILNRVLPALPSGVLVHFHDVFLPDDYPESWEWRGYNEQNAVAALLHGGGYDVLFASHFVSVAMRHKIVGSALSRLPLNPGVFESSLWLRKR